jgi:hypothetical protein
MPRNLNLAPSNAKKTLISKKDASNSSSDEDLKELLNKKREINKIKERTVSNKL